MSNAACPFARLRRSVDVLAGPPGAWRRAAWHEAPRLLATLRASPTRFSVRATRAGHDAAVHLPFGHLGLPLLDQWAPFHSLVVVGHAGVMNEVLRHKQLERGFEFNEVAKLLGSSVLTERGQRHRELRAALNHAFVPRSVQALEGLIQNECERAADVLPHGVVDLRPHMRTLTLRILCRTMFELTLDDNVAHQLDHAVSESGRHMYRGVFTPWRRAPAADYAQHIQFIRAVAAGILAKGGGVIPALRAARVDDGQRGLSDSELVDEVCDLLLAGHITTANILSFMFHGLARHPEWQRVDLASHERVWLESLRLYPTAAFLARHAQEACEVAGVPVARGTMFIGVPYAIQRNPVEWHDPARFDPLRFDDPSAAQKLVAFGTGVHVCLGKHLAALEARSALAVFAERVTLTAVTDAELPLGEGILVEPGAPALVRVQRRVAGGRAAA